MKGSLYTVLTMALIAGALWSSPPQRTHAEPAVDAKIEAVWPHDERGREVPVVDAPFVNVEVYLFERGTLNPISLSFPNTVTLEISRNVFGADREGKPTEPVYLEPDHDLPTVKGSIVGRRITENVDGKTFPAWVFDDVPVRFPLFPSGVAPYPGPITTYFTVRVDGADYRTNVWSHGAYSLTVLPIPNPLIYAGGVGGTDVSVADALIQIVWAHDQQGNFRPVTEATLANVGVDLASHPAGSLVNVFWTSVGFGFSHQVRLLKALDNGFLEPTNAVAQVATVTRDNPVAGPTGHPVTRPQWIFNDVDVSAANDPVNRYYFAVQVDGVTTHTTIWAHGADGRTYFPQKDVPARSAAD